MAATVTCLLTTTLVIGHMTSLVLTQPWINVYDFQEDLNTMKDYGLGVEEWQYYLDRITYDKDLPDGKNLADQLAGGIGTKFTSQIEAIKRLKTTIEAQYDSFSKTQSSFKKCCELSGLKHNTKFRKGVDTNTPCELISGSAEANRYHLNQAVADMMKENLRQNPYMKWQYFGSKDGVMTIYPANKYTSCDDFDPRFRPWYVEATIPIIKEVVIVIDSSKSMLDERTSDGISLMDVARQAAATVLETLASHDQVGVVSFNDHAKTRGGCFDTEMARATAHDINLLKEFINNITPSGGTSYVNALRKAFSLLQNTQKDSTDHTEKAKVILFLSDGVPKEDEADIMKEITRLQTLQSQHVTIMTYAIGESLSDTSRAVMILKQMADISKGVFKHVKRPNQLRSVMAKYYDVFKTNATSTPDLFISVPYFDAFGLGKVTTVTMPVKKGQETIGVLGIDVPLNDLFSDSIFNRHYLFVIDFSGRAWRHPLLTNRAGENQVSTNINIELLERNKEAESVIASMKRGETGSKTFYSHHLISMGDPSRDGVVNQNLNSTYHWTKVPGLNFSVCLVYVSGDVEEVVALTSVNKNPTFVYHRYDVTPPMNACRHFQRVSTMKSALKFSPESYLDPSGYLDEVETKATIEQIKRYMTFKTKVNPGFMRDIQATAAMTTKADDIWLKDTKRLQKYIIWRYIGTYNGVTRILPLAKLDKAYNPTYRPWYRRALSQPDKSVFSTPYLDAFGAGFVITLSHTLYKGSNQTHKPGDTVIAVLGADFTLGYFYKLIIDTFPKCREKYKSCYVIDNSGYVIIHIDFVEPKTAKIPDMEYMHITVKDPGLARYLITSKLMKEQGCIDIWKMRDQVCWKVDLGSQKYVQFMSGNPKYEVSAVEDSNIFIVIKEERENANKATPCSCIEKSSNSVNEYECKPLGTCQCPCYRPTTYSACKDQLHVNSSSFMTCAPKAPSLEVTPITEKEKREGRELKPCYQEICKEKMEKSSCQGLLGCSWCQRKKDGGLLETPYCADQDVCYLGVIGLWPYPKDNTPLPPTGSLSGGAIAGIVIGCLCGVALVVILAVVIIKYRRGELPGSKPPAQPSIKMELADKKSGVNSPYSDAEILKHFDPPETVTGPPPPPNTTPPPLPDPRQSPVHNGLDV